MSSRRSRPSRHYASVFDFHSSPISGAESSLIALIAVGILAGGGGVGAAFGNLAVQLTALFCMAVNRQRFGQFFAEAPAYLRWLVILTLALPTIQLVPLPPFVWQSLPGRELVTTSLTLIDAQDTWRPITVDFAATLVSALSLLPPVTVLILAYGLSRPATVRVLLAVVVLAMLNLAVGALQLSTDNQYGNPYPGAALNNLYGTFANRNSAGIFLLTSILAAAAAFAGTGWLGRRLLDNRIGMTLIVLSVMLAIGTVLTQSRSSTLLLAFALVVIAAYRILQKPGAVEAAPKPGRRRTGTLAATVTAIVVVLAIALLGSAKLGQTGARFADMDGTRVDVWADAMGTAKRYFPIGSGMGTFDQVFQVDETIERLSPLKAGRAHNELLELSIEAGVFGLALVLAWAGWLIGRALAARDEPDAGRRLAAMLTIVVIALQSLVDYPLRNEAMLCVAALMVAILSRPVTGFSAGNSAAAGTSSASAG